jgi:hypothetical protein
MKNTMIYLESVHTYIDESTGNMYPALGYRKSWLRKPINVLDDPPSYWFKNLSKSKKESKIVNEICGHIAYQDYYRLI